MYFQDSSGKILQKGDLVEFKRPLYKHWGIYECDGYIIHVTGEPNAAGFGRFAPTVGSANAVIGNVDAEVKREKLLEVADGDKFYKNNLHDDKKTPFKPEEIIRRASKWIGKSCDYQLITKNCEHFVSKMRYDYDKSQQVVDTAINFGIATTITAFVTFGAIAIGTLLSKNQDEEEEVEGINGKHICRR